MILAHICTSLHSRSPAIKQLQAGTLAKSSSATHKSHADAKRHTLTRPQVPIKEHAHRGATRRKHFYSNCSSTRAKKKKKRFCSPQISSQIKSTAFRPVLLSFIDHLLKVGGGGIPGKKLAETRALSQGVCGTIHGCASHHLFCLFSPFFFPHPHKHTPRKHLNHPASPDM